jgi:hypothetical protein
MPLLVAILTVYMAGWTGYAWETWSTRHPAERVGRRHLLFAGGWSLVAAGVPLSILAIGTDLFVLALVHGGSHSTPGLVGPLVALLSGPVVLIALGVRASRGDVVSAWAGTLLGLAAYVWLIGRADAGWLTATAPGLIAPLVLLVGLITRPRRQAEAGSAR